MSPTLLVLILVVAAYLVGAIPFGYCLARLKGVDLFQTGSGNIGATNVGRVLGRKWGVLIFILDFLKGVAPVALVPVILRACPPEYSVQLQPIDGLRVGIALAAFLGHLFPVFLRFRGGKGVATGGGAFFVLLPGPVAISFLNWLALVVSFRYISVASILAIVGVCITRLATMPLGEDGLILTLFCFGGTAIVIWKHRGNLRRLTQGTESRLEERPMFDYLQRTMHLIALGLMLGSAVFFNLVAAPTIFRSLQEVAFSEPGDRTAQVPINTGLDDDKKKQLGNALAGAAVGPIFPLFFGFQAVCGVVALITAAGWWNGGGKADRWRVYLTAAALATIASGWPLSKHVTSIRLARFSTDAAVAATAQADFGVWHLFSLGLSLVSLLLVIGAMLLAAKIKSPIVDSRRA